MKSLKLLTSTLILGAVLTACSSDSDSGNFKPKNEIQEDILTLYVTKEMDKAQKNKTLSYEEIKAKYNIPTNAKICKYESISGYVYNIVFADSVEEYENFLKSGKYDRIYIPIFYINHYVIGGKEGETKDSFKVMDYNNKLSLQDNEFSASKIDPKTCE
ncbi:hypothetical protein DMB95_07760 [Campylobacter sp. MIT 12-8780]|uniref:hypothetical protein n=1 Tax=Campylobacter sp. MIT 12-8780 TaxID=2202200 RepID=UPI00115EB804|nr:hypothetical protein [Campylobacter sp. MIT 12-8780]TQR40508.1 hypothetical protein DMB95_07760 [Campylobacter sp. MIT 12-8780]